MRRVAEFLSKAELAERSASRTADAHFRELLRAMAREWRSLAEHARAFDDREAETPAAPKPGLDPLES